MSIRMIVLTDAHDGSQFRIAAHAISHYYRHTNMTYTRLGQFDVAETDVAETLEEIDRWFNVCWPDSGWQPQEVDESENLDGDLST